MYDGWMKLSKLDYLVTKKKFISYRKQKHNAQYLS